MSKEDAVRNQLCHQLVSTPCTCDKFVVPTESSDKNTQRACCILQHFSCSVFALIVVVN